MLVVGALLWLLLGNNMAQEEVSNCWSPVSRVVYDIPTASIYVTIVPTMLAACRVFADSVSIYLNISAFNETMFASLDAFNYSTSQTITFTCPQTDAAVLKRCVDALFTSTSASLYLQTVRYGAYVDFTSISGSREHLTECFSGAQSLAMFDYTSGSGTLKFADTGLCNQPAKPEIVSGTLAVKNSAGTTILTTSLSTTQTSTQQQSLTFSLNAISNNQLATLLSAIKDPWINTQLNYSIKVSLEKTTTASIPLSMNLVGLYSSVKASCVESITASIYGDRIRMLVVGKSTSGTDCRILSNGQLTFNCHLLYTSSNLKTTMEGMPLSQFNFTGSHTIDFQCANGDLECKSLLANAFNLTTLDSLVLILQITETGSNGELSFYYKQQVTDKRLPCWEDAHVTLSGASICVYLSSSKPEVCPVSSSYDLLYTLILSLPNLGAFTQIHYFSLANNSVCWTCDNYTTAQVEGGLSCTSALKSFASSYRKLGRNRNTASTGDFTQAIFTATYAVSGITTMVPIKRLIFLDTSMTHIIVSVIISVFALLAVIHLGFGLKRIGIENLKLRRAKKMHAQKG